MKRRSVMIALGACLAASPRPSLAQATAQRPARVGFLGAASKAAYQTRVDALLGGFRELGYIEGANLVFEQRWAESKPDRLPDLAAELVRLKVDVIVTHATTPTRAALRATPTIPIVIATVGTNPVESGLVQSLSRPGGTVTGLSSFGAELSGKRLELLNEVVRGLRRITFLGTPGMQNSPVAAVTAVARALDIKLTIAEVRVARDVEGALSGPSRGDGIVVHVGPTLFEQARTIAILAARLKLPSSGFPEFAEAGGMLGLGVDYLPMFRRAAYFVDRILKGARAGDLPMEQPTKFELLVNLATARAIGVSVPSSVIVRADRVIS